MRLINQRASKLIFENKMKTDHNKIRIKQQFGTRVAYHEGNKCTCYYTVTVIPAEPGANFKIEAEIIGLFEYDANMRQAEIHIEAARQLYPYLRAAVMMLTSMSGSPPFILREHEIKEEDIVPDVIPSGIIS